VPVAERRRQAEKKITKMKKDGHKVAPVTISGLKIARTFWGEAWCRNLEAYSDYANRLPRGRTYVRNGSVIDLQIEAGHVRALVSGSSIYKVDIAIKPLSKKHWTAIKTQCAGQIDSLVELLKGSISKAVMEIVTRKGEGLFPTPSEITLDCSCPDWATMCKHVAATLYGVGARLDSEPALLFTLRGVDPTEMVAAAIDRGVTGIQPRKGRTLADGELSSIFGVEIEIDKKDADDASAQSGSPKITGRAADGAKKARPATKTKKSPSKPAVRKPAGKTVSKKKPAKKTTAGKTVGKQTATAKTTRKKTAAKKPSTEKTTAKKNQAKKAVTTKNTSKKKKATQKTATKAATAKSVGKAASTAKTAKKTTPVKKSGTKKPSVEKTPSKKNQTKKPVTAKNTSKKKKTTK
jgi:uncharacterized Zn finger protein